MKRFDLPFRIRKPILACGADMKGAFALAKGRSAYLFDGFGDLADPDNFTVYEKAVKGAVKKLKVRPAIIAHDLHPGYFSTQFAQNYGLWTMDHGLLTIQHHESHVASAILDNNVKGDAFGVAFDGTGYGADENIWGGEFFTGNIKNLTRAGHLDYIPMPGGEKAVTEPWRMAASYLYSAFGNSFLKLKINLVKRIDKKKWAVLKEMIDKKVNSPLTSSAGRLFDAAGSLIFGRMDAGFEAELPIGLERIIDSSIDSGYDVKNTAGIIAAVARDLEKKTAPAVISAKFHNTMASLILKYARRYGKRKIVLTGGVFQNKYLLKKTAALLKNAGFTVYTHRDIPTNDSGIPMGQIMLANARVSCV